VAAGIPAKVVGLKTQSLTAWRAALSRRKNPEVLLIEISETSLAESIETRVKLRLLF
jgi:hypothetical protein